EAVKVRVRHVAAELAELRAARPGVQAELGTFEGTGRMYRIGEPEAGRIGARGHVAGVGIVRVGDPERRGRVVRGNQDVAGVLSSGLEIQAIRRGAEGCEVRSEERRVGKECRSRWSP